MTFIKWSKDALRKIRSFISCNENDISNYPGDIQKHISNSNTSQCFNILYHSLSWWGSGLKLNPGLTIVGIWFTNHFSCDLKRSWPLFLPWLFGNPISSLVCSFYNDTLLKIPYIKSSKKKWIYFLHPCFFFVRI